MDKTTARPPPGRAVVARVLDLADIFQLIDHGFDQRPLAQEEFVEEGQEFVLHVFANQGIRVNAVCPGIIHTPMIERAFGNRPQTNEGIIAMEPVGRLGKPEETAEAVVWLCSDAASFVTGLPMAVDGGFIAQ